MVDFKNKLKHLRLQKGLTQEELAKKIDVSKSSISMYENGNREPDFETMEAIADLFNVNMDFLYGRPFESSYYLDPRTQEIAEELNNNPGLQVLFDAARDMPPEDIQFVKDMIDKMKK